MYLFYPFCLCYFHPSQMRYTQKVSVWPVGLVGGMKFERPVVENGKVVRFHTGWRPNRPFPIDMAGFAVSLKLLLANSEARFDGDAQIGFLESSLLENMVTMEELEPKADMCNKVGNHFHGNRFVGLESMYLMVLRYLRNLHCSIK